MKKKKSKTKRKPFKLIDSTPFFPKGFDAGLTLLPGLLLCLFSAIILTGWYTGNTVLVLIHPSFSAMNPLTALLFFFWGLALISRFYTHKKVQTFLFALLFITPFLKIILDQFVGIRIDHLLISGSSIDIYSSSLSTITAISFMLIGAAGVFTRVGDRQISSSFYVLTAILGFLGILQYVTPHSFLVNTAIFQGLALHTSLLFFIFSLTSLLSDTKYIKDVHKGEHRFTAFLLISIALILFTLVITLWVVAIEYRESELSTTFEIDALNLETKIENEMTLYTSLLTGGVGLFNGTETVSRENWKAYVETFNLEEDFPGIQGIGYSQLISPEDLENHIQTIREEGFSEYIVYPEGERELYSSIVYLEPFADRNLAAFGYDMYSQETRKAAMDLAAKTGNPSMSGKVILVQETDEDIQAGFLVYIPVYKEGVSAVSQTKSINDVSGFVYSVFRAGDLMNEIAIEDFSGIDFILYDGEVIDEDQAMFISNTQLGDDPLFSKSTPLEINGRTWTLYMQPAAGGFLRRTVFLLPWVVAGGGIAFSLVLFAFITALLTSRSRAIRYANLVTKDIRKNRDQLAEQNAKNDAILTNISDGLIVVDPTGGIQLTNSAFTMILGWEQQEVEKANFFEMIHLYDGKKKKIAKSRRPLYKVLSKEKPFVGSITNDYYFQTKTGEMLPVTIGISPVMKDDKFLGAVISFRDIRSEKSIDKAKSEFVSLASHQLKAPLTAITWTIDLLSEEKLSKQSKEYVYSIQEIANRMKKLVEALLNASRIDLGTFKIDVEEVDLPKLLKVVLNELKPLSSEKKIKIKKEIDSRVKMIKADPNLMKVILQNLISNALKYSSNHTTVFVSIEKKSKKLLITVKDEGMGIPIEDQQKIFNKLFRGANAVASQNEGTGLGLYIIKSILDASGGKIWFESQEGEGTTFYVELPEKGMKKKAGTKALT